MNRVLASATVTRDHSEGWGHWIVTVTGLAPHDLTKKYAVTAATDNLAAQEGLRLFVEEMGRLSDQL